jgi:O-antigen/teichoic acid export membrane protein
MRQLKSSLSDQLINSFSWLAMGEIGHRILRIGTVVILARVLTPHDYGLIAIIFLTIEFSNLLTFQGGITSKLIHTDEQDLHTLTNTAYWMNWLICGTVFLIQCLVSFPVALLYQDNQLILPICAVGLTYWIIPLFTVQAALIQRENRMKIISIAGLTNSLIANTLTISFALLGMGIWSVVLAHILSHVSWLTVYLRSHSWRPTISFNLKDWQKIFKFAKYPIGIEFLDKLRANLDYILIGHFIGVEQLGLYYFAFNAGLGISLSVIRIFSVSLLPYFCIDRENIDLLKKKYFRGLQIVTIIALPLIALQSSLANLYVPIVFGQKWIPAIPILILICLSAIPRPYALVSEQLLLSIDKGFVSLRWNLIFTIVLAIALLIAVQWNILAVAICVLIIHLIALPAFSIWTARYVFSKANILQARD